MTGGAAASSAAERVRMARQRVAASCDGVLVSIPYEHDDHYLHALHEVANTAPPSLMLPDWDAHGYGVPVAPLVKLFETVGPG